MSTKLPSCIYVEVEQGLKVQVEGLPKNWFPMTPSTCVWSLDSEENVEIVRKGFPMVPDFSCTIHLATGRTIKSEIGDLGGFEDRPSHRAAMEAYIGLSRTTDAEGILITRPFPPKLFQQGPQPFPTYLMDVLQGKKDFDWNECTRLQAAVNAAK